MRKTIAAMALTVVVAGTVAIASTAGAAPRVGGCPPRYALTAISSLPTQEDRDFAEENIDGHNSGNDDGMICVAPIAQKANGQGGEGGEAENWIDNRRVGGS